MPDSQNQTTDCPAGGVCAQGEACETRGCLRLDPPLGYTWAEAKAFMDAAFERTHPVMEILPDAE